MALHCVHYMEVSEYIDSLITVLFLFEKETNYLLSFGTIFSDNFTILVPSEPTHEAFISIFSGDFFTCVFYDVWPVIYSFILGSSIGA